MEIFGRRAITLLFLAFYLGMTPHAFAYEVKGRISISKPYPQPKKIQVADKHQAACGHEQVSEALIVSSEGSLKNAVVSLKGDFKESLFPKSESLTLNQKNCNFRPHVLVVPQNSPFFVANSDPMAHDVRIFDQANMLVRFEMDVNDKPVEKRLEKAGTYVVRCGLHKWMHAFFIVNAPHPYFSKFWITSLVFHTLLIKLDVMRRFDLNKQHFQGEFNQVRFS